MLGGIPERQQRGALLLFCTQGAVGFSIPQEKAGWEPVVGTGARHI